MKLFNVFTTIIASIDHCLWISKCIPNRMDPIKAQELSFTLKNVNDL